MTPIDLAAAPATEKIPAPGAAAPCAIIIFGASGDLTKRKLLPALYELASEKDLAPRFAIVGFARSALTDDAFRDSAAQALRQESKQAAGDAASLKNFVQSLSYIPGEYHHPDAFQRLSEHIDAVDKQYNLEGNRLFYLATPPDVYPLVIEQIQKAGLQRNPNGKSWVRIVIEKPFGHDQASARELNRIILNVFDESQVFRIDHYLGKETVQNLVVLRFGNGIFEPIWNRNFIDHVQITAAETLGVEQRANFYEITGSTRDMIQSHVLQLTQLVAIEPPTAFEATALRNEKIKVLQCIHQFTPERVARDVVRGQYGPGTINGKAVSGYRRETGVNPDSATETFTAARLKIENWRWAGVPFYLRTGKRLHRQVSEIAICFRRAPHLMFVGQTIEPNWLVLNIQPEEGISICFQAKLPGTEMRLKTVSMDFNYRAAFGSSERSAYATLLNDCMRGDATLFDRADGVEAAWALVDPILAAWNGHKPDFPNYPAGSWGPDEADQLLERDGRRWRKP